MRKTFLLLSVLALAACNTDSTSPDVVMVDNSSNFYFPSSPPPPPNDSGSVASSEYGLQAVATRYFLNIPNNSGWLAFQKDQAPGVTVDNNARVTYSKGVFSGTGAVRYVAGGGVVTLNLAGVSQSSSFNGSDKGYYNLVLNGSTHTLGGVTRAMAPVTMRMTNSRGGGECSITAETVCTTSR